ncbi:MAG: hypothetical protein QME66_13535 [Candidatus Eisenbacteria bacterium]|nr:hypothetical protein [Candidatus Eisenbacteria bacterium]
MQVVHPIASRLLPLAAVFIVGALLGVVVGRLWRERTQLKPEAVLPGTDLPRLRQFGSFAIYSKQDATNEFAVFSGHECLVSHLQDETNETWETTHFENGQSVLVTKTRESGAVIERMFSARDTSGQDVFSYVDTDGDGQWDVMLDFVARKKYIREERTWVPASEVKRSGPPGSDLENKTSSAESVGQFGFREFTESMIEGGLQHRELAETAGSSGHHSDLVVEIFDGGVGECFFAGEPVQD